MAVNLKWTCAACGNVGFDDGSTDGFFYCVSCGAKAEDIIDTGIDDEDLFSNYLSSQHRLRVTASVPIEAEPISSLLPDPQSVFLHSPNDKGDPESQNFEEEVNKGFVDEVGPTGPADFGSSMDSPGRNFSDYSSEVRMRYVMGVQIMLEMQCEALVKQFQVSSLICGFSGPIWLRFIASTGILDDSWAELAIHESESQEQVSESQSQTRYKSEPYNIYGKRGVMIWLRCLRKKLPLRCSLAVCFLACHVARESVLPTDIQKWSIEGKLPYLAAFLDIEKTMGSPSKKCPISPSIMFRPSRPAPSQKLESLAASIAQAIGLKLPPVDFFGIACRYVRHLGLSEEKVIPHACEICDWLVPQELRLSANDKMIPTRVYVMSILIVATRIIYDLHGYGFWEMGLSSSFNSSSSSDHLEPAKLLKELKERFDLIEDKREYSQSLDAYLQYCKDVVFAGMEPEYYEEQELANQFWNYYQENKKRYRDGKEEDPSQESKKARDEGDGSVLRWFSFLEEEDGTQDCRIGGAEGSDEAIQRMKADMDENLFYYIPPRVNVKRRDYLHYNRKRDKGSLTYVAHADYYILLRACARVAEVDLRLMHIAALRIERRLASTEHRLRTKTAVSSEVSHSSGYSESQDADSVGLSMLSF